MQVKNCIPEPGFGETVVVGRIQILPDEVQHKIAAGEVVEGPFSIIKELIENSLDAGATNIDVEIEEAGMKKILVRDDGGGIFREDMPFVAKEHATSKIRNIEDIYEIGTFGFRGEALSSIASISELTIMSRRREERIGAKLTSRNGACEVGDYAGAAGCTVIAENLFFNVPARKKFLRSPQYELRAIKDVFCKTAIASPNVSFRLIIDGKTNSVLPRVSSVRERIGQIFGDGVMAHLIEGELMDLRASIVGLVSGPAFHRPNRSLQYLYVNGRPIEYKSLGFLLSKSYESMLRHGEHPAAFLFIRIEASLLDVNVHPAKKEVRFFDQNYVNSLILNVVRKCLGGGPHHIPDAVPQGSSIRPAFRPVDNTKTANEESIRELVFGEASKMTLLSPSVMRSAVEEDQASYTVDESGSMKVEVLFDTYLVVLDDEGLVLIDYHAAHERILFDALMDEAYAGDSQALLFPHPLELSPVECERVLEKQEFLHDAGFEIEEIGKHAIAVRGIPAVASSINIDEFFQDVAGADEKSLSFNQLKKIIAEKIACHAAFRAGDGISHKDARDIASRVLSGNHETRCPHGRPFLYRFGKSEFDKMFKRA